VLRQAGSTVTAKEIFVFIAVKNMFFEDNLCFVVCIEAIVLLQC